MGFLPAEALNHAGVDKALVMPLKVGGDELLELLHLRQ